MQLTEFNQDLLAFLRCSPTPFHAVEQMSVRLRAAGFVELQEQDDWQLSAGKYFVTRNGSSIVAFNKSENTVLDNGFRMVGAHTDSPCLKVKPAPELLRQGYFQLGVEVYGGVLLNPWFDRDLSLAGRVSFKSADETVASVLIDFQRPIATIPSLAIHLNREANSKHSINAQKDIPPILMQAGETVDFRQLLLDQVLEQHPDCDAQQVLDYELSFYDCQAPALIGFKQEFIAAARLDNLLSCFTGLQALLKADQQNCVLVCNDHEEVGSQSAAGAQGPMLRSVLRRLVSDDNELTRVIDRSMMISADNAHGIHPNFADRHDGNHGPLLNQGAVIKLNANQRYATNSETSALFRYWSEQEDQPVQSFVVRTDMGCGSTIGPIIAGELGVKTLDVGVPTFAMHSIRELAGSRDAFSLYKTLSRFNHSENITVA